MLLVVVEVVEVVDVVVVLVVLYQQLTLGRAQSCFVRPAERPLNDGRAAARREVRVGWVGRIEHPQSTLILCAFKAAHSETEAHLCQQWAPM